MVVLQNCGPAPNDHRLYRLDTDIPNKNMMNCTNFPGVLLFQWSGKGFRTRYFFVPQHIWIKRIHSAYHLRLSNHEEPQHLMELVNSSGKHGRILGFLVWMKLKWSFLLFFGNRCQVGYCNSEAFLSLWDCSSIGNSDTNGRSKGQIETLCSPISPSFKLLGFGCFVDALTVSFLTVGFLTMKMFSKNCRQFCGKCFYGSQWNFDLICWGCNCVHKLFDMMPADPKIYGCFFFCFALLGV